MNNMDYELFLRDAFGCDRGGDPGGLAEASYFESNLSRVKIGVGYAMAAYIEKHGTIDGTKFYDRLLTAENNLTIHELIQEFKRELP